MLKITYNRLPSGLKQAFSIAMFTLVNCVYFAKYSLLLKPLIPVKTWFGHSKRRGMHLYIDWLDWIGGYPYEVATPQSVQEFLASQQFAIYQWQRTTSLGCNEFVFKHQPAEKEVGLLSA
jgi:2-polyprenyl-6-hydroxyphenyl methylase/3-demethylubiquinone-9 3-methyltransferase